MRESNLKITALMIVFNEEKFLDICLSKIINYADYIVIVEGAVKHFWSISDKGKSTDRTVDIIQEWQKNYKEKIRYISGQWQDKHTMQRVGFNLVPEETEYIHIVDADEIYEHMELMFIREMLETERPDVIKFRMRHWGIGGLLKKAGIFNDPILRLFRWEKDLEPNEKTINIFNSKSKPYQHDKVITLEGQKCDHYGHIDPIRLGLKSKYYAEREEAWNEEK